MCADRNENTVTECTYNICGYFYISGSRGYGLHDSERPCQVAVRPRQGHVTEDSVDSLRHLHLPYKGKGHDAKLTCSTTHPNKNFT